MPRRPALDLLRLRHALVAATALPAWGCGTTTPDSGSPGTNPVEVMVTPPPETSGSPIAARRPRPPGPPPDGSGYSSKRGLVNRTGPARCDSAIPGAACAGSESHRYCKSDADCKEGSFGRCLTGYGQIGSYCGCSYSCATDSDCGGGQACVCKGSVSTESGGSVCAQASCRRGADCASGECGVSSYNNGCGIEVEIACRTRKDACRLPSDCEDGTTCAAGEQAWSCQGMTCAIGRPLWVDGRAAVAPAEPRPDWSEAAVDLDALDCPSEQKRQVAASHYREIAALEHASIASFARFTLQLMALGAPAELIADSQKGGVDEVRHAKAFYALATAFDGASAGPGLLPEAGAPLACDPASVLVALIREGCVGETLGAAEAAAAANASDVASLCDLHRRIAEDEMRHAALAWRSLAWLLGVHPELRTLAERTLQQAAEGAIAAPDEDAAGAVGLGILSGLALRAVRRDVARHVLAAAAEQLELELVA